MRRIVVNGRFLAQPRTGVQRYALETLRALDRLIGREPRYLEATRWQLALPFGAVDVPLLENFEIQMLQFLDGHAWEQLSLAAFARGAYLVNPGYSGPLFMRRQLITVHDAAVRAQPAAFSFGYRLVSHLMMAVLAPRVDTLMTVSRFSAEEIVDRYNLDRDDLVVGRCGWEHVAEAGSGRAVEDDAAVLRRYGLASQGYLLAVGSPKANKNFGLIARAVELLDSRLCLPVVVAGARNAQVHGSRGHDDADALRWLGYVPDDDLHALYRHAAWFIFPSLYEGFGLPALEALAHGCPVLAARSSAIPEVLGDAVLYFDPHDPASLASLLDSVAGRDDLGPLRDRLREQAAVRLKVYRWSANARILLARLVAVGAVELATPRRSVTTSQPPSAPSSGASSSGTGPALSGAAAVLPTSMP